MGLDQPLRAALVAVDSNVTLRFNVAPGLVHEGAGLRRQVLRMQLRLVDAPVLRRPVCSSAFLSRGSLGIQRLALQPGRRRLRLIWGRAR